MENTKILTIKVYDIDREGLIIAVEEVLKLLKEGYNSGFEPLWGIEEINED